MKKLLIISGVLVFLCIVIPTKILSTKRRDNRLSPVPWMQEQIQKEISQFKNKKISLKEMRSHFYPDLKSHMLAEVQIKDNKIYVTTDPEIRNSWVYCRYDMLNLALKKLRKNAPLPDVTFFLSLWDSYERDSQFPIFVFAKNIYLMGQIQIPDCFAVERSFVIEKGKVFKDILPIPWEQKIDKLAWRGSTSQGVFINHTNFQTISRFTLCQLSLVHPDLIDAGFTLMFQGADTIQELQTLKKEFLPYSELVKYKYQIWIDGNSASYTDSGWRFFSNSVVLKPDSENVQWYYPKLEPGVHYIPVKRNLEDLVEKIQFLQANDSYAKEIAKNALQFGADYLSQEALMRYLYSVIWEYSKLEFVE
ncbi:MAG TPA: glycosyl transferase family 90 [Rhabdochlamydiaceae bacterium]|nr:glycosyl transferase family 90 [Rhabdochlamydiaceae bacterium]HSX37259.1 glycosyl transferase family 90 [Chlamydiales bacterium]